MNESQIREIFNKPGGFMSHFTVVGAALRDQYQPTAIAKLFEAAYGKTNVKIHIGCGGGKTLIFVSTLAYLFVTGEIQRSVLVAPTIQLGLQLQTEFQKAVEAWCSVLGISSYSLTTVNVSSLDNNKKNEDLLDETPEDDEEGVFEEDEFGKEVSAKTKRFAIAQCEKFQHSEFKIATSENDIKKHLYSRDQRCFFVCKPSFLNKFIPLVTKAKIQIDVSVLDEYHNFISQNKSENIKTRLNEWDKLSNSTWYFSATRRSGDLMSHMNEIFGEEIVNIRSGELVDWGYLCPKLNIYVMQPKEVRGIPDIIRQYFEEQQLSDKQVARYFKEFGCIFNSVCHAVKSGFTPKIVVFSHSVKFIKLLKKSDEACELFQKILGAKMIFEQIDGSTPAVDRDRIFGEIRNADKDVPVVLLNHSVIKEGTDIRGLNSAVICRGMSQDSLQQALGRIQRADVGKEFCNLYLYVPDDESDILTKRLTALAHFIHYVIGDLPVTIMELVENGVGVREQDEIDFEAKEVGVIPLDVAVMEIDHEFINAEIKKLQGMDIFESQTSEEKLDFLFKNIIFRQ